MEEQKVNKSGISDVEKLMIQNSSLVGEIKQLWAKMEDLSSEVRLLKKEKDELVAEVNDLNAYNRRSNIELRNISESVKDDKLEEYCLDVLAKMEMDLSSYEIVACHRLGKFQRNKTRSVILRFTNRKYAYDAIYYQSSLKKTKFEKIFITENLCPTHRKIFGILYKAFKGRKIDSVWTHHGFVCARMEAKGERFKITSIEQAELFVETSSLLRNHGDTNSSHDTGASGSGIEHQTIHHTVQSPEVVTPALGTSVTNVAVVSQEIETPTSVPDAVDTITNIDDDPADTNEVEGNGNSGTSDAVDDLLLGVLSRVAEDGVYRGSSPNK